MSITKEQIAEVESKARDIRETIIEMLTEAKSGHTAGPLGMADVFSTFYFHILKHNANDPDWEERDRLILSNGHIVPVRYATMAHAGYFPLKEVMTLRKFGTRLQGHPEPDRLPGLETNSGPLGSGLSQAAGIAYGLDMDGKENYTYCLLSDGELQAGNTWEAAMFAGVNKLNRLICVIDRNNIQINGMTQDVMPLEPLADKFKSFGFHVIEIDGHSIKEIVAAVDEGKAQKDMPTMIIAKTVPGKGIPEIEGDYTWHGKPPTPEEAERFLKIVRSCGGRVTEEYS
ncbi:transketolase [Candidatus Wolfebacteria bacterium]|nr:transketolase [Candidatus Wolfebacteria bacterium]